MSVKAACTQRWDPHQLQSGCWTPRQAVIVHAVRTQKLVFAFVCF